MVEEGSHDGHIPASSLYMYDLELPFIASARIPLAKIYSHGRSQVQGRLESAVIILDNDVLCSKLEALFCVRKKRKTDPGDQGGVTSLEFKSRMMMISRNRVYNFQISRVGK